MLLILVLLEIRDHNIHERVADIFKVDYQGWCIIIWQEFYDVSYCQGIIRNPLPDTISKGQSKAVLIVGELMLRFLMYRSMMLVIL